MIITLVKFGNSSKNTSKNQYRVSQFEDCGIGGVEIYQYRYRIGYWTFYHPNGKIKAEGTYKLIQTQISTRCELNEVIEFSEIADDWLFYNQNGNKIKPTKLMLNKLNCVSQDSDEFLNIQYCFEKAQNRVIHKIIKN